MKISIQVEGGRELARKISRLNLVASSQVKAAVAESSLNVQRMARRRAPVDLGRLRASINAVFFQGGMTGEVTTNVGYAWFVEFGTGQRGSSSSAFLGIDPPSDYQYGSRRGMPAKPFLFPSWEQERPNYLKNIESIFKGLEKNL